MADSKKPGLILALGGLKPKGEPDSDPKMKSSKADDSDFDSAAEEAFHAVSDGDLDGFKLALKAAIMACHSESDDGDY